MTEHPAIEKPEHPAIMNLMREMLKHRCVLPQGRELEELARAAYRLVAEQLVPEDEEMQEWIARTVNWMFCEEDYDTFTDKPRAKSDALALIRAINAELKRRMT